MLFNLARFIVVQFCCVFSLLLLLTFTYDSKWYIFYDSCVLRTCIYYKAKHVRYKYTIFYASSYSFFFSYSVST